MSRKKSLSGRLIKIVLIVTSVIFAVSFLVAAISSHILISKEATKSTERLLDATISDIEQIFQNVEVTVKSSSWLAKDHISDKDYLYYLTRKIVSENPIIVGSTVSFEMNYFDGLYYFSPYSFENQQKGGEVESKQLGSPSYDYFSIDWFQIPYLMGEACWSEPMFDDGGGEMLMTTYSYPLKDEDGHVYAIMTADVSISWFSKILSHVKPYPNSNVFLISRANSFINVGTGNSLQGETVFSIGERLKDEYPYMSSLGNAILKGEKGMMQYKVGSKVSYVVYGPLSNGWTLAMTCDYKDVLSAATKMHQIIILIGLLGLLVLGLLCYYFIRNMTRPLTQFSETAASIAKGNFDTQLPVVKSDDEIKDLRDSFDYMQTSIKDYMENLRTTTAANERMSSELNIASKIQQAMLPVNFPHTDVIDVFATLKPAKEVGGDLYDFFIKDNILYFAIGDVSGKGIPASMFMSITKAAFNFIAKMGTTMEDAMFKMNNAISDGNDTSLFVTMFIGALNLETGELQYCNAGHNPPVVISPDGTATFLDVKPNLAVGLLPGFPYQLQKIVLEKGSYLLSYTDGVTEAERGDYEQYGEDRLMAWTDSIACGDTAETVCRSLADSVFNFVEGNAQNDDITIMIINYK